MKPAHEKIEEIENMLNNGWRIERADAVGDVIVYVLKREV